MMGIRFGEIEAQMHIPIDNYVIEAAKESADKQLVDGMEVKGLDIKWNQNCTWSRCDRYDKYIEYQDAIIAATHNRQLVWEEKARMAMAIRHSIEEK